jgi:hypothetical protein
VQFPADLTRAPYSVIAAGVRLLPQKLEFPFSLVSPPAARYPGISPAFNELRPAWVLAESLYTIRRNEIKYRTRYTARRTALTAEIMRPEIVDLMRQACGGLEEAAPRDVYTERDIPGLGKNYLREPCRRAALAAYRRHIALYALLGLKDAVRAALRRGHADECAALLMRPSVDPCWEHQRRILSDDLGTTDVLDALQRLPAMLDQVAHDVERARARDDERGRRIIDDYAEAHAAAADDPVVRQTFHDTRALREEVFGLIAECQRADALAAGVPAGLER